ncbi:MAG: flagellar basal body P-ring formation chaperone FlgA [Beijerinckiaceae bacterium]|nr:flagellar basal body P-ring formation chaperone FlgA [Beijerinckiaceae bacterium]
MNHSLRIIGTASLAALVATGSLAAAPAKPKDRAPAAPAAKSAAAVQSPVEEAVPAIVPLTLKSEAIVNGDVVRFSDLINGVDPRSDVPVFRAPELGQIGTIQAARILSAAAENNLGKIDTRDLTAIIVRRSGHIVAQDQILDLVREALNRRFGLPADTELVPEKTTKPMIVEADARRSPQVASFIFDNRSNRFEATFTVPGSEITTKTPYRIAGALGENIRVPIVTRALAKGDTITANDISIERRKRVDFTGDAQVDPEKVAGQIARHAMRSGDIIASGDIVKAEWVERGSLVTLVYETPGMSLSTKGRAITGGSEGDTVSVQNLQSKRTVEGVIIGPGKISVQNKSVQPSQKTSALEPDLARAPTRTSLLAQ